VHEVSVGDVRSGSSNRIDYAAGEQRIDVARTQDTLERNVLLDQRLIEGLRGRTYVVEPEKPRVDPARAKRRKELEDMSFRTTDAPDSLDVENLHRCSVGR